MTPKPYDPEAAVAEFERLGGDDNLLNYCDTPRPPLCRNQEWPESKYELDPDKVKDWLRAALDAAYRAGKREAEDECEKQHGRVNTYVVRADGVEL